MADVMGYDDPMAGLTLGPPAAEPLDLSGVSSGASTPPFVSPQTRPVVNKIDRQQMIKMSILLGLAAKAGPGAVQGVLRGFAQHDQLARQQTRQDQADALAQQQAQRADQQSAWQQQYQRGELANQTQQRKQQFLSDFASKVQGLDDPAAIDALTKLYTAQAPSLGLQPAEFSAYAQTAANPTRLQKKAAERKIAQWKSEYGADKWMEQAAQFVHEMPGAPVDPTTGQPKRYTVDEVMALAGEQRNPNAPKPPPKDKRGFTTKEITLDGKRMLAGYDPDTNTYYAPGDTQTPLSGQILEYHQPPASQTSGATADTAESIADAIIRGEQPPETTGLYRFGPAVKAILAKKGYNQAAAITDWRATQQHVRTLNGAQQTRLNQAVDNAAHSLDVIEDLAAQWKGGKFPALNRGRLIAAKQGALGPQAQQIATALDAQIADVTAELGNVYMGGNSPTDHALSLAAKNLSADWSEPQLRAMVNQARTNLQIRRNSIVNAGVAGASANNVYTPQQAPADQPAVEEWVRDASGRLVKRGAK